MALITQSVTVATLTQLIEDHPGMLTVTRNGVNICHMIVRHGEDDHIMRMFLNAEAIRSRPDIYNAIDPEGYSPLMLCAWLGKTNMAQHLLAMPAIDVELANNQKHTALTYAVYKKNDTLLTELLRGQLKIETIESGMRTAFSVQYYPAIAMLETKRNGMPLHAGIVV